MSKNIEMLAVVANGLGEMKNEVVFVGGSVAELYANDPAASDIRATLDVDCVVEISSSLNTMNWKNYYVQRDFITILHRELHFVD
ncbi:MAG: hypothetical protein RSB73_00840, partial [Bacteroidales bacterium]